MLSDPSTGTSTVVKGRNAFPADDQPTVSQANTVHLAWDVMVGGGTFLALLAVWWAASWIFRRDIPRTKWFLRIAACCGVLSVLVMEAGWVVTEVGRQPWIVRDYMRVEDAATGNTGVWITFVAVVVLYLVVAVTTVLVLRGMSRRWREAGGDIDETDVPYGPAVRSSRRPSADAGGGEGAVSWADAAAVVLFFGVDRVRAVRRRRLRCGVLGPHRRRRGPRRAPARARRPLDRAGVGGQPRLADLLPRGALDRVLRGVRLDHADAVRAA